MHTEYDVAIVGAGILGLATARSISLAYPAATVVVLEKEDEVARHQSGRNSGVIHSGLYYRPGSLKARLCVSGAQRMVDYCREREIPYTRAGKVVVASSEDQLDALAELERRGLANGVTGLTRIDGDRLREIEPHAVAVAALHVPTTGAVDFGAVCRSLALDISGAGVEVRTGFHVESLAAEAGGVTVESGGSMIRVGGIINCGGLYSDHIARLAGVEPTVRIIPFRGEFLDVVGASAGLVNSSIYPVPDPRLPFLGVHLTRGADGGVHAGPNAVLAGAREGYGWGTLHLPELWESVRYRGLRALARRHWRSGLAEVARSMSRRRFAASVRLLVPGIDPRDLVRGRSGVRAQAVTRDGALHDDFLIATGERSVHVLNAPSPAATSALAIGDHIAAASAEMLGLA